MASRSVWRPRGCATCGTSVTDARRDGTRGSRDEPPRASGWTRWTGASRRRPTSARGPSGRSRKRRRRPSRRRPRSPRPSSSSGARSSSSPRPGRRSPRRPTGVFGWPRWRRICAGSRSGSPRRRRSSRAAPASSRRRSPSSRRRRTPGAMPRTSAGASPRRPPRAAPRWRRSAARSPRTIGSVRGWRSRSGRSGSAGRPARPNARRSRPMSNASTRPRRRSATAGRSSSANATGSRTRWPSSRRVDAAWSCAGLRGQLNRAVDGWDRALRAGLGSIADAVVYEDAGRALADAPTGEGATFAVAGGGPAAFELSGERTLLSIVDADPAVRGLVSTLLKDVYLAETLEEAAAKRAEHPKASYVTPDGVLVGPALIRTTLTADSRAEEVRRELAVVERDLARSVSALTPRRARLDEISGELAELAEVVDEADARITHAAERIARIDGELSSGGKEEAILSQRLAGMDDAAAAWRENLAAAEPVAHELPELPRTPEPPIQARVAVETLRRERDRIQTRLSNVRAERDT